MHAHNGDIDVKASLHLRTEDVLLFPEHITALCRRSHHAGRKC